jgi:hypothetical protein
MDRISRITSASQTQLSANRRIDPINDAGIRDWAGIFSPDPLLPPGGLASYLPPLGAPAQNMTGVNNVTIVEAVARFVRYLTSATISPKPLSKVVEPILEAIPKTASTPITVTLLNIHSFRAWAGRVKCSASATQMTNEVR